MDTRMELQGGGKSTEWPSAAPEPVSSQTAACVHAEQKTLSPVPLSSLLNCPENGNTIDINNVLSA